MSQYRLHSGNLQYHDFPKLRELHQKRLASSLVATTLPWSRLKTAASAAGSLNSPKLMIPLTTNRTFFGWTNTLTNKVENLQLKGLETVANARPTDPNAQYDFLSRLFQNHPQAVVDRVSHPMFRNFAVDSRIAVLYLQALAQTGRYSQFNLDDLVKRLEEREPGMKDILAAYSTESRQMSKQEQVIGMMNVLMGGGTAAAGSMAAMGAGRGFMSGGAAALAGGGLRGQDPKNPVYVQIYNPTSARAAFISLTGRVLIAFVVVSAISALLDEKGVGRGLGMNSGSKHIQQAQDTSNVSFDDVKGVDEAKAELQEIVMYLKNPAKFTRLGGKLPRGLLLTGPPGTGKTLLAKAIAGEADVPFFFSSGSQFEEVYVGLGAKRIRELFEAAKKKSPCIIFIDEIDAVGGSRKLKDQSALKMTLNELLVQMDGFEDNNGIIVIGATNFIESLDQALLRPGRFDKHITVPLPDVGGRKEILEMYAKKTKLDPNVDLNVLARGTTGFSGADLYNLMNQAALKASVDGLSSITMSVLEYAKDKILMGAERKTAVITKETARCTAYHEAGHALVAVLTDGAMPIHKATIMPRGASLGMVTMLPDGDQTSQSVKQMKAMMDVAMGGRVAEELVFGKEEATSGAMSDIANATAIARNMVTKYGFSEEIGLVNYGGSTGEEHASDETRNKIDAEVKRLTDASYKRARELLMKHTKQHKLLANTLLEYETLTGDEVRDLVKKGIRPKRPVINKDGGARGNQGVLSSGASGKSRLSGLGKDSSSR
ncbi:ATP-dependent metalloprotease FtsH [Nitzschia inconspicua]|uniref:ATP-dependent metalloprotease FtsH n=1 Tax=Nitzschia inconspicua TaxID=303405 RepID=A0A9K3KZ89_9STRA|nr:ATP-dependent metalloprotease FtsH [Nitzschia inconspicua]